MFTVNGKALLAADLYEMDIIDFSHVKLKHEGQMHAGHFPAIKITDGTCKDKM